MEVRRRQLTLFVDPPDARALEAVRRTYDPIQAALIAAHVTLCREDELPAELPELAALPGIAIAFGPPVRFADGKGVLLPGAGDNAAFHALRRAVHGGRAVRPHAPHITLIHPRNATCTDAAFAAILAVPLPATLRFREVRWIEQIDGGPWTTP